MLHQTGHDAQQRTLGGHRQPKGALQRALALRLARHIVGVIRLDDVRVGGRIERHRVNAVEHPNHPVPSAAKQTIQPLAVLRRHDFLRIRGTHRADHVAEGNTARHAVERSRNTGSDGIFDHAPVAETGERQRARAELSLIRQVVDGEDRGDVAEGVGVDGPDVIGQQGRMPVVTVHDIGLPSFDFTQVLHERQDTAREQNEATIVVVFTVDGFAFERRWDIEQIRGHRVVGQTPHPQLLRSVPDRQERGGDRPLHGHGTLSQFAVARHHHAHIMACGAEGSGERTGHVGQSARLDEGGHFGGGEKHTHWWTGGRTAIGGGCRRVDTLPMYVGRHPSAARDRST